MSISAILISAACWGSEKVFLGYEFSKEKQYLFEIASAAFNDPDRLKAMGKAGNCYANLQLSSSKPKVWNAEYTLKAYECGIKNFLPPSQIRSMLGSLPDDHPLGLEADAADLGYTAEAQALLIRALENGSESAGYKLVEWELDGVLAPPDFFHSTFGRVELGNAIIISRCLDALIRLILTPVGRSKILKILSRVFGRESSGSPIIRMIRI